jgi:hypothetical protein
MAIGRAATGSDPAVVGSALCDVTTDKTTGAPTPTQTTCPN